MPLTTTNRVGIATGSPRARRRIRRGTRLHHERWTTTEVHRGWTNREGGCSEGGGAAHWHIHTGGVRVYQVVSGGGGERHDIGGVHSEGLSGQITGEGMLRQGREMAPSRCITATWPVASQRRGLSRHSEGSMSRHSEGSLSRHSEVVSSCESRFNDLRPEVSSCTLSTIIARVDIASMPWCNGCNERDVCNGADGRCKAGGCVTCDAISRSLP